LPGAKIILSTWEGSEVSDLDYDILVLNKDPGGQWVTDKCFNNSNRQLVSIKGGLELVKTTYALKLRSELELMNCNFLRYWKKFSVSDGKYSLFTHKVITSSIYSKEFYDTTGYPTPFHPSDFLYFGLTRDLCHWFSSIRLMTKNELSDWSCKPEKRPEPTYTWRYPPEQYFFFSYVKLKFPNIEFNDWADWNETNMKQSNCIIYNNFIFLDYEELGIWCEKHFFAFKDPKFVDGLITFECFVENYKKYCDINCNTCKETERKFLRFYKHIFRLFDKQNTLANRFEQLFVGIPISALLLMPVLFSAGMNKIGRIKKKISKILEYLKIFTILT
jgi:hypothetical protein